MTGLVDLAPQRPALFRRHAALATCILGLLAVRLPVSRRTEPAAFRHTRVLSAAILRRRALELVPRHTALHRDALDLVGANGAPRVALVVALIGKHACRTKHQQEEGTDSMNSHFGGNHFALQGMPLTAKS